MSPRKTKHKELAWRSVRYGLMVVTIGILSITLLFVLLGYRFNSDQGTFQQGGLVQFISKPEGAQITVGSAKLANKTRSKITLIPGSYLVKMEREGYELWQKNITVHAGKVLWLNSARLVPRELNTTSILPLEKFSSSSVRPNGKYMAILRDGTKPDITRVVLADGQPTSNEIAIPASVYKSGKRHSFSLGDWSQNDRHILVRHKYDKRTEWLLVDTDSPARTIQIPVVGKATPVDVIYDPRVDDDLVVRYSDNTVRLVDGATGRLSAVILSKVKTISGFSNSILYTSSPAPGKIEVGYLTLDKSAPRVLASYTTKKPVYVAMSRYFGEYYLTTSVGNETTIEQVAQLPSSDNTQAFTRTVAATFKTPKGTFSINTKNIGRFIVFSQSKATSVYDLELGKLDSTPLSGLKKPLTTPLPWIDEQHFWSDAMGLLRQYEFDGANQANLVKIAPGTSAGYSTNGTYLYSIAKASRGYQVERTRMILE